MKKLLIIPAIIVLNSCVATKIQDCPETKIINRMPTVGESTRPNEYYIYKGERKELTDFDQQWLKRNCPNIEVQEVH